MYLTAFRYYFPSEQLHGCLEEPSLPLSHDFIYICAWAHACSYISQLFRDKENIIHSGELKKREFL